MPFSKVLALSRPRYWFYLAGPYLIGYTIAAASPLDFTRFTFLYTLFFFLIPANIFLYGVDDFFESDASRKISKMTIPSYLWMSLIFALPLLIYLNTHAKLILIGFLALSAFYSMPPLRFKTMPFFDIFSNILYILPGFLGFVQLAPISLSLTCIVALTCWPAGMYLLNKYSATALYLGRTRSLLVCFALWLIFALFVTSIDPLFVFSFIYPAIPLYLLYHHEVDVEKIYSKFPVFNTLIGVLLFLYLLYIKLYP